jgi:hypothetical protein
MIHFSFSLRNPFYKKFKTLFYTAGSITQNKKFELEIHQNSNILGLEFSLTTKQDHAGMTLGFSFLTLELHFQIYDKRHWNSLLNNWQ